MKLYLSRITADHWTAKNNLEKAAHELAKDMDRRLLTENQIKGFKKEFQDKVDELNILYYRCKPLRFSIESREHSKDDYSIYCDGVFNMSLFLVKTKGEQIHATLEMELSIVEKLEAAAERVHLKI